MAAGEVRVPTGPTRPQLTGAPARLGGAIGRALVKQKNQVEQGRQMT
jgi:hypothetical protein